MQPLQNLPWCAPKTNCFYSYPLVTVCGQKIHMQMVGFYKPTKIKISANTSYQIIAHRKVSQNVYIRKFRGTCFQTETVLNFVKILRRINRRTAGPGGGHGGEFSRNQAGRRMLPKADQSPPPPTHVFYCASLESTEPRWYTINTH